MGDAEAPDVPPRPVPVDGGRGDLALVMSGGGARAAYQAGVLRGIARRYPDLAAPILTGVSAGAINQVFLASRPERFQDRVERLCRLWCELETERVFDVGPLGLFTKVFYWGMRLVSGGHAQWGRKGMVDPAPLRESLQDFLDAPDGVLTGIREQIERSALAAVAVTTSCYRTGRSITWVQGREIDHWRRADRRGVACQITIDHVLASAALPLFFPAVPIGPDWYGDGGMRLTAPLSPAIHLGARRLLAISTRYVQEEGPFPREGAPDETPYPTPAQVAGNLLGTIFLDQFDADALRLERINRLLRLLPPERRPENLHEVDLVVVRPSIDLGRLATEHEPELPRTFRWLVRGFGTRKSESNVLLSLVMFQPDYARRLIEVGEADAEESMPRIARLLE